ncbi:MAG TPA: hypothetical protein VE995_02075 [Gaiellaceae bacterium]|nr:hypothetical protein [Gaiellaceae bacterium]
MRRALSSVAIGLAGAAGVTATGWALQAAALPPPAPAARMAADATVWLHEHRLVIDVFHSGHRRTSAACLRGWFRGRDGTLVRGSLLGLRGGPVFRIAADGRRVEVVRGRRRGRFPARLALAAGCSGELAPVLARVAQNGGRLRAVRAYAAGRPAVALGLRPAPDERLVLDVSPRTFRPLAAVLTRDGRRLSVRLYLARAGTGILERFGLARLARPRLR